MAPKLLVIDDSPEVLRSVRLVFESEGYEVITEEKAKKALHMVLDTFFEVIFCDWQLPDMDGLDLVEILDKRSPKSAIIMISGFPAIKRATESVRRGAAEYLAKPFTPDEALEAVKRALAYKKSLYRKDSQ